MFVPAAVPAACDASGAPSSAKTATAANEPKTNSRWALTIHPPVKPKGHAHRRGRGLLAWRSAAQLVLDVTPPLASGRFLAWVRCLTNPNTELRARSQFAAAALKFPEEVPTPSRF